MGLILGGAFLIVAGRRGPGPARGSLGGLMRRRRSLAGVVLVVAGVGVLGWVGWQVWGTTWVSERRHDQIATELEQEWRAGAQLVQVEEGPATAMVEIPAFGEDYRVPLLEGTAEDVAGRRVRPRRRHPGTRPDRELRPLRPPHHPR